TQLLVGVAFPSQTLDLKRGDVEHSPVEPFKPGMSQEEALARGQKEAESIVSQTLGADIPGPVEFPR
ncbi:MAG: mechanosensitive ion channel family protein, partial [Methylophaga sp.]|nr:mechanosensitive ion channel family protein [Methylophaga sp.]